MKKKDMIMQIRKELSPEFYNKKMPTLVGILLIYKIKKLFKSNFSCFAYPIKCFNGNSICNITFNFSDSTFFNIVIFSKRVL